MPPYFEDRKRALLIISLVLVVVSGTVFLTQQKPLTYGTEPVQAANLFRSVTLAAFAYYSTVFWLASLAVAVRDSIAGISVAVGGFALLFFGYWVTYSGFPRTLDALLLAIPSDGILRSGALGGMGAVWDSALNFPGSEIVIALVSRITGFGVLGSINVVTFFVPVAFGLLLFAWFNRYASSPLAAAVAVFLVAQGAFYWRILSVFHPGTIFMVYLATAVLLVSTSPSNSLRPMLMELVLVISTIISYFVGGLLLIAFWGGIALHDLVVRKWRLGLLKPLVAMTLFLAWLFHVARSFFRGGVLMVSSLVREGGWFGYAGVIGTTLGRQPMWVFALRSYWLLIVYVLGGIAAWILFRRRPGLAGAHIPFIGLTAVAAVSILLAVLSGGTQLHRFFLYWPLFAGTGLGLWEVAREHQTLLRLSVAILTASFLVSFPTFLASNTTIAADVFQTSEFAASSFLHARIDEPIVFLGYSQLGVALQDHPHAAFVTYPEVTSRGYNAEATLSDLTDNFLRSRRLSAAVFLESRRMVFPFTYFLGRGEESLLSLVARRLDDALKIYSNGFVSIWM